MKLIKKTIVFVLIFALCLSTVSFAMEIAPMRASEYIRSYEPAISAKSGTVTVSFSIDGTGTMTSIGARYIYLYEISGNSTTLVKTFRYTDNLYSHILGSNSRWHSSSVSYQGVSGCQYYAMVSFYAANSSGSDSALSTTRTITA